VFGHGRWLCSGKPLAMIEINKTVVEVSISFSLDSPDNDIPPDLLLMLSNCYSS
jgi:hypothetical protein